jgi:hypothetical protein
MDSVTIAHNTKDQLVADMDVRAQPVTMTKKSKWMEPARTSGAKQDGSESKLDQANVDNAHFTPDPMRVVLSVLLMSAPDISTLELTVPVLTAVPS